MVESLVQEEVADVYTGTTNAKQFDAIVRGIAADLGGESELTTVEKHLIETFAGAALQMHTFC